MLSTTACERDKKKKKSKTAKKKIEQKRLKYIASKILFEVEPRWPRLPDLLDYSISLSAGVNTSHIIKHKHFISSLGGDFSGSERNTGANNRKLRSDRVLPMEGKHVIIHVQIAEAAKKEKMKREKKKKKNFKNRNGLRRAEEGTA